MKRIMLGSSVCLLGIIGGCTELSQIVDVVNQVTDVLNFLV